MGRYARQGISSYTSRPEGFANGVDGPIVKTFLLLTHTQMWAIWGDALRMGENILL